MPAESTSFTLTRREFLVKNSHLLLAAQALTAGATLLQAEKPRELNQMSPRSYTPAVRPRWWIEDGLVMAGLDWESLLVRLRDGNPNFPQSFTSYDENIVIWRQEHSREIAHRLKEMGFNFVMIPLHKGGGFIAERDVMESAKQFTAICHEVGLRVGCYTCSGALLYEPLLAEDPDAKDWFTLDHDGKYVPYGQWYFRRWVNRSHPGFQGFVRQLIRFAIKEAKVDLLHFDNYVMGPGYEEISVRGFRKYITNKYSPAERKRRFGFEAMDYVQPPPAPPYPDAYNGDPIYQDFIEYRCDTLAATYRDLANYAQSLNPDVIVECNPGGYVGELKASLGIGSVDHSRLIKYGGAYWDEARPSGLQDGILVSNFRSHMIGRHFDNMVFNYTGDRVAIAESMANNLQCLGCPSWVTGNQIMPSTILFGQKSKEFDPGVLASIRFFHKHQEYYRDARPAVDVAVLNTFANTAYGPSITRNKWSALTQALYQGKIPFTLLPEDSLEAVNQFKVLILADLALISDELLSAIRFYIQQGGGLVMTGQAASFDEHSYRRAQAGLSDLFSGALEQNVLRTERGKGRAIYVPQIVIRDTFRVGMLPDNEAELLEAVSWAAAGPLQIAVKAPQTVTMSLYSQPSGHRILHLVNYDKRHPVHDIGVTCQLSSEKRTSSVRLLSPDFEGVQSLVPRQTGHELRFTVPRLEIYDLLVID